jgi:hypothetical protein
LLGLLVFPKAISSPPIPSSDGQVMIRLTLSVFVAISQEFMTNNFVKLVGAILATKESLDPLLVSSIDPNVPVL